MCKCITVVQCENYTSFAVSLFVNKIRRGERAIIRGGFYLKVWLVGVLIIRRDVVREGGGGGGTNSRIYGIEGNVIHMKGLSRS